ncbi:DUF1993 domain-containing protein [Amantichitinum ursilacus]|uniref:DUF1993 domain-containing protein n=1 Tax=Amantichitinum ursilacus TaxID=857265 RepID=A0A0N1JSF5_9NEIS|nr:DUF1993 domain-containing protein [Amantichitinum ursilacus]KPC52600.1 hypothetical protein WG78_12170 [Amantichitinum ursilacus]
MLPHLYTLAIPTFRRYLTQLDQLIALAQQHADAHPGLDVLDARIAPDMLPWATQIEIACNFVARTCLPLAGRAVPPHPQCARSFAGLRQHVALASALLDQLDPQDFLADRIIRDQAGQAWVELPAADFLLQYALPNFIFHFSTAYLILRSQGVALGKAQFDGLHVYPPAAAH